MSPLTVQLVVTVGHEKPPGLEVTVYPEMAAPPVETGAVQDTTDWALPLEDAVTPVGAPGTVAGMAGAEAADAGPVPAELVAVTVNVYDEPLVRPGTVQLVAAFEQVKPPGAEVTV